MHLFSSSGPKGHSELLSYQCVGRAACVVRRPLTIENNLIQTSSSIKPLELQFSNFTWSMT